MERLQKVLARAGVASRRAAESLIAAGRVTVNGSVVTRLGTQVDADRDAIKVDGNRVRPAPQASLYLMLHKPRGVVTTLSDPEGRPTVRDYLRGVRGRVFPVGRLDFASEGLLLLTSDGALARDLMHPSRGVQKTYAAKVRGTPSAEALKRLAAGIVVEGRRTLPARVRLLEAGANAWVEITVVEGRRHQVRNMLEAVGHRVQRLRRIRYGGVELGSLRPGALRALDAREVERLRRAAKPRNPLK
jgi:pseudouridine synthase